MRPLRLLLFWKALLLCSTFTAALSAFAGLLQDPGFEVTKYSSPWTFSGTVFLPAPAVNDLYYPAPYAGSRLLKLEVLANTVGSMSSASQTFPALDQQQWTFSGHMLNYSESPMKAGSYGLLEIVFTGSSYGEQRFTSAPLIQQESYNPALWSIRSFTATAPIGSEYVTFYVKHVQGEVPDSGTSVLWWDEMNATVVDPVPELASTGWVAVLVIGIAIGGRRLGNRRANRPNAPNSL